MNRESYSRNKYIYNSKKNIYYEMYCTNFKTLIMPCTLVLLFQVKTCKPAMGYSFAAGTTDGPGAFNFEQGKNMQKFSRKLFK